MHCPFCKGEVDVKSEAVHPDLVGVGYPDAVVYWVSCMKSGCPGYHRDHVGEHRTKQAAVDAWCVHDSVRISKDLLVDGWRVTSTTLVGHFEKSFPRRRGNCFSMVASDGREYRILNFYHENLVEAIRRGVHLPVAILPVTETCALVADERLPGSWYADDLCSVCTPPKYMSVPSRIVEACGIWCGAIVKREHSTRYHMDKMPDLRTAEEKDKRDSLIGAWKIEEEVGVCSCNSEAIRKLSFDKDETSK
jgi:hypothetical protein